MYKHLLFALTSLLIWILVMGVAQAQSATSITSVREITNIEGVRDNQLLGYGIVVGLNGTGDGNKTGFTSQSLTNMLSRMGITVNPENINVDNVAAVMVTASLPPFAEPGNRIDVSVASLGDATSLEGGTLLLTPLRAPNGDIFAVAQGQVSIGGFNDQGGGGGGDAIQNHATSGLIANGALVEQSVGYSLEDRTDLVLTLKDPDFGQAERIADVINEEFGEYTANPRSSGSIRVRIPADYLHRVPRFLAKVQRLPVEMSTIGKVVINEKTGTIVIGSDVRIAPIAISHGSLSLQVQPPVNEDGEPQGQAEDQRLNILEPQGVDIGTVVEALNKLGVTPRDLIAILQALDQAGAISGELEFI